MQTLPEEDLSSANNQIQNHNNYNEDHEHEDEMFKAHVIKKCSGLSEWLHWNWSEGDDAYIKWQDM